METQSTPMKYRFFEDYCLLIEPTPSGSTLYRRGSIKAIATKAVAAMLARLTEKPGELCRRRKLAEAGGIKDWDDRARGNLRTKIKVLRDLLHDSDEKLIETIPGEGYRFSPNVALESFQGKEGELEWEKRGFGVSLNATKVEPIEDPPPTDPLPDSSSDVSSTVAAPPELFVSQSPVQLTPQALTVPKPLPSPETMAGDSDAPMVPEPVALEKIVPPFGTDTEPDQRSIYSHIAKPLPLLRSTMTSEFKNASAPGSTELLQAERKVTQRSGIRNFAETETVPETILPSSVEALKAGRSLPTDAKRDEADAFELIESAFPRIQENPAAMLVITRLIAAATIAVALIVPILFYGWHFVFVEQLDVLVQCELSLLAAALSEKTVGLRIRWLFVTLAGCLLGCVLFAPVASGPVRRTLISLFWGIPMCVLSFKTGRPKMNQTQPH